MTRPALGLAFSGMTVAVISCGFTGGSGSGVRSGPSGAGRGRGRRGQEQPQRVQRQTGQGTGQRPATWNGPRCRRRLATVAISRSEVAAYRTGGKT